MKIIIWQLFLGFIQWVGYYIGGKKGILFSLIFIIFWTITQTYGGLLFFQLTVQSIITLVLFRYINKKTKS